MESKLGFHSNSCSRSAGTTGTTFVQPSPLPNLADSRLVSMVAVEDIFPMFAARETNYLSYIKRPPSPSFASRGAFCRAVAFRAPVPKFPEPDSGTDRVAAQHRMGTTTSFIIHYSGLASWKGFGRLPEMATRR